MTKREYMKRWRRDHREEIRAAYKRWYQQWYPKNAETLWAKGRAAWAAGRKRVDRRTLKRCRKNPQLAGTVGGPGSVVCLNCGQLCEELNAHVPSMHKMSVATYQRRWKGAPVTSVALRSARSKTTQKHMADVPRRFARYEKRRREVPDFLLLERAVAGVPASKIAKEVHRAQGPVSRRLRESFEVHGPCCVYRKGQPINSGFVAALKRWTGLSAKNLKERTGLSRVAVERDLRHRPHRLRPERAWIWITCHNRLRDELVKSNKRGAVADLRPGPYSGPSIVKSAEPELPGDYKLCLRMVSWLKQWRRKNSTADFTAMVEQLCREARLKKTTQSSGVKSFLRFVKWLAESDLKGIVERDFPRLGGADSPHSIALGWVASYLHTTSAIVSEVLKPRTGMVPAQKMRKAIHRWELAQAQALIAELKGQGSGRQELAGRPAAARRKRGAHPKAAEARRRFEIGRDVAERIPRFEQLLQAKAALPTKIRRDLLRLIPALAPGGWSKEEIAAAFRSNTAKIAARYFVSHIKHLEFKTVAEYHRLYLQSLRGQPLSNPL